MPFVPVSTRDRILNILKKKASALTMSELSYEVGGSPVHIMRQVWKLSEEGLISKGNSSSDKRIKIYSLIPGFNQGTQN